MSTHFTRIYSKGWPSSISSSLDKTIRLIQSASLSFEVHLNLIVLIYWSSVENGLILRQFSSNLPFGGLFCVMSGVLIKKIISLNTLFIFSRLHNVFLRCRSAWLCFYFLLYFYFRDTLFLVTFWKVDFLISPPPQPMTLVNELHNLNYYH